MLNQTDHNEILVPVASQSNGFEHNVLITGFGKPAHNLGKGERGAPNSNLTRDSVHDRTQTRLETCRRISHHTTQTVSLVLRPFGPDGTAGTSNSHRHCLRSKLPTTQSLMLHTIVVDAWPDARMALVRSLSQRSRDGLIRATIGSMARAVMHVMARPCRNFYIKCSTFIDIHRCSLEPKSSCAQDLKR
jgi:hypothetical protein